MRTAARLREHLASGKLLVASGAYDAIGARMIEQAGCDAACMTGAGRCAAHGFPDLGLLTFSEMAANATRIARSVRVPLIADTGYGNGLNVTRTVREYEAGGVAALHIEDQVAPKRCCYLAGKEVVPPHEFLSKIRVAASARRTREFVLIARTDARSVMNLEEAIWRANAALDAGADIAFVEGPQGMTEMAAIPQQVKGPCMLNIVPNGMTAPVRRQQVEEMGYCLAILPTLLLGAPLQAGDAALVQLRDGGAMPHAGFTLAEMFGRFGAEEWDELRTASRPLP